MPAKVIAGKIARPLSVAAAFPDGILNLRPMVVVSSVTFTPPLRPSVAGASGGGSPLKPSIAPVSVLVDADRSEAGGSTVRTRGQQLRIIEKMNSITQ
jgi:hypothetical protein